MELGAGWVLRGTRALVLSAVALLLAVVAHTTAGGQSPGPVTVVVMLGGGILASGAGFGREATTSRVVALLVAGQAGMHLVMTAVSGHGEAPEPPPSSLSGFLAHAAGHLAEDLTPAEAPMALAHLVAAALVGLWLARGERVLWSLLRLLAGVARTALALPSQMRPAAPSLSPQPRPTTVVGTRLRSVLLSATHLRRGPPRWSRALTS